MMNMHLNQTKEVMIPTRRHKSHLEAPMDTNFFYLLIINLGVKYQLKVVYLITIKLDILVIVSIASDVDLKKSGSNKLFCTFLVI